MKIIIMYPQLLDTGKNSEKIENISNLAKFTTNQPDTKM